MISLPQAAMQQFFFKRLVMEKNQTQQQTRKKTTLPRPSFLACCFPGEWKWRGEMVEGEVVMHLPWGYLTARQKSHRRDRGTFSRPGTRLDSRRSSIPVVLVFRCGRRRRQTCFISGQVSSFFQVPVPLQQLMEARKNPMRLTLEMGPAVELELSTQFPSRWAQPKIV